MATGSTKLPWAMGWPNGRGKGCPPISIIRARTREMMSADVIYGDALGCMEILSGNCSTHDSPCCMDRFTSDRL